jgi:hypothetical protein
VGCKENWQKYRSQRNLVTKLRKKSINVYLSEKCNSKGTKHSNSYEFWKTLKPLISKRSSVKNDNIVLKQDDVVITNPDMVSDMFNSYFTNIAKDIGKNNCISVNDNIFSCFSDYENHESVVNIKCFMEANKGTKADFSFNTVEVTVVKSCINKLESNKATGYDLLPSKLLKQGSDILCYSICTLVNMTISSCSFPNALKCAEITPLFKKGNNLEVCNYRPVSILPSVSKIFERQIAFQLSKYFDDIFSKYLSGFRSNHSCESVLLRMVENIKHYIDDGKIVCVLMMDLTPAFDCLHYKLFVCKLTHMGSLCQHVSLTLAIIVTENNG